MIPLDVQRQYPFVLSIGGRQVAGGVFESPLGDEGWRNVSSAMREATERGVSGQDGLRRQAETIKDSGRKLFRHLGDLSPELQAFLAAEEPRRLVVQSGRPEIHLLPWEAMVDSKWRSVADTDLSVVHSIDVFDERPVSPALPLKVQGVFGPGTERRTLKALDELQQRTTSRGGGRILVVSTDGVPKADAAIAQVVQVEAHGDAESGELDLEAGDPFATSLADGLQGRAMLLLWSCFSALVHSWGESLSLKLHRQTEHLRPRVRDAAAVRHERRARFPVLFGSLRGKVARGPRDRRGSREVASLQGPGSGVRMGGHDVVAACTPRPG